MPKEMGQVLKVLVNGGELKAGEYTVSKDSQVVSLTPAYLATLEDAANAPLWVAVLLLALGGMLIAGRSRRNVKR